MTQTQHVESLHWMLAGFLAAVGTFAGYAIFALVTMPMTAALAAIAIGGFFFVVCQWLDKHWGTQEQNNIFMTFCSAGIATCALVSAIAAFGGTAPAWIPLSAGGLWLASWLLFVDKGH